MKSDLKYKYHFNIEKENFNGYNYFDIPIIIKQNINIDNIDFVLYKNKTNKEKQIAHFYMDDYQFNNVWNDVSKHINKLKDYYAVCTPDFSLYLDYPIACQIYNTYRNRWLGAYWQKIGLNVIPTISWSDERSFYFCFEGIEKGSIVTVSTMGCIKNKETKQLFINGYNKMLEIIEPEKILIYGNEIENLKGNIKYFKPFYEKFREKEVNYGG